MTPAHLLLVLRARWLSAALALCAVLAVTALVNVWLPRGYTATAVVMLDLQPAGTPEAGGALLSPSAVLAAQVDIFQSERVALQVMATERLADDPVLGERAQWQRDTGGQGDYPAWRAARLLRQLDVRPGRESGVIAVSFTAPDRALAARLANAFVQAQADVALQLRLAPARARLALLDEQMRQRSDELAALQARLAEAAAAPAAAALPQEVQQARAALEALAARRAQAQVAAQDTVGRMAVLKVATAPAEASSPRPGFSLTLAAILGTALAVAVALQRELRDRRLRRAQDVPELLGLPMLVEIPAADRRGPRRALALARPRI
jgi:polysaccharide biosynthesis transport protein